MSDSTKKITIIGIGAIVIAVMRTRKLGARSIK